MRDKLLQNLAHVSAESKVVKHVPVDVPDQRVLQVNHVLHWASYRIGLFVRNGKHSDADYNSSRVGVGVVVVVVVAIFTMG